MHVHCLINELSNSSSIKVLTRTAAALRYIMIMISTMLALALRKMWCIAGRRRGNTHSWGNSNSRIVNC